jgi:hypothetical protein
MAKDIFEEMGLPPIQDYEMDPKGFRMEGTEETPFSPEQKLLKSPSLHPEVQQALTNEASTSLEKAGISKTDPRHADLLDLELELRMAQVEEDHPGFQDSIRNLRIADVMRTYGKQAPAVMRAMGLSYKDPKKKTSKEDVMLDYLKQKRARATAAEEKKYKRDIKKEELEVKRGSLLKKEKEKETKEAHAPLDREIKGNISQIDKAIGKINENLVYTPKNERLRTALKNLSLARKKLYKAARTKDSTEKEKKLELLNKYLDRLASEQKGI